MAQARQTPPASAAQEATDPAQAKALLMRMAEYLAKAQAFSVTVDASYDVVQGSGQKIEFGEVRRVLLNRPDDLRIDVEKRDGLKTQIFFDGKDLTLFNPGENVFARLTRPGSVDEILYYFVKDLQTPIPLSLLLVTALPQEMEKRVTDIAVVGHETLAGKPTEHLAARTDDLDFQVWMATGDEPVPLRIVLTYKHAAGQPQFSAMLSDWNFHPQIDPAAFVFVPSAGAESVAFMVPAPNSPGRAGSGDRQ